MKMETETIGGIIVNRFKDDKGREVHTQVIDITNEYKKYDLKGRLKEVKNVKSNGEVTIYKYSYPKSKNERIKVETYEKDELIGTKITDYDNLKRKIYYKEYGIGVLDIEYLIEYHGDSDIMKKLYMYSDGEICSNTIYDDKGNEIEFNDKDTLESK